MPSVSDTHLENRWEVQPNHSNNYETAHGGNVMKWMDSVGGLSAMRFAGKTCVTARMGAIDFGRPIPTGQTVFVRSWAFDTGRTSVDVQLKTYRENPLTGEADLATETTATYVAIGEEGEPVPVPDLDVDSPEGQRLLDEARGDGADRPE
jgi:acyl-CoA hydrolase